MDVEEIEEQTLTTEVPLFGKSLLVSYRPYAVSTEDSERQTGPDAVHDVQSFLVMFVALIDCWDLNERDGSMVALEVWRLSKLPLILLSTVVDAVMQDLDIRRKDALARKRMEQHVAALADAVGMACEELADAADDPQSDGPVHDVWSYDEAGNLRQDEEA